MTRLSEAPKNRRAIGAARGKQPVAAQPGDPNEVLLTLERQAEVRAPGVLELIETYGRVVARPSAWTPINTGAVSYSVNANPEA